MGRWHFGPSLVAACRRQKSKLMNPMIWLLSAALMGQTVPAEVSADRRAALEAFLGDAHQYEMFLAEIRRHGYRYCPDPF